MPNLDIPEGLSTTDLECVMVGVPSFDIQQAVGELWDESALFYGDIPTLKYAQGAVAEEFAHLTLLFGIHPSLDYEELVYTKLAEWDLPDIFIDEVSTFPSREEGQNYVTVIAKVVKTAGVQAGRAILESLPHTDSFPEYKPHVTLVYLKTDVGVDVDAWIEALNGAFAHKIIPGHTTWLDLGLND